MTRDRLVIGWREWIGLPDLSPLPVKAKIDSGARTSAIHAFDIRFFSDAGAPHVAFTLHPIQRRARPAFECHAAIIDQRAIRSSNGGSEIRPVIEARAQAGDLVWTIELTLAARDEMGFRMLLGREALRRRFLVDPGRSFRLSSRASPHLSNQHRTHV